MEARQKPLLRVTAFSDYICPYCYLGWLRLEKLRSDYDLRVNWCMTEIHPDNPIEGRPATELGYSPERWNQMVAELQALGTEDGVRFGGLDSTANSHRALLLAEAAKGEGAPAFYALHRRLFEAFLREGRDLADEAVLRDLVDQLGLAGDLPDRAWSDPGYERRLRDYQLAARDLGVEVTPTYFIGTQRIRGLVEVAGLLAAAEAALT